MNRKKIVSGLVPLLVIATSVGCSGDHSDLEDENRAFVYAITEKPTAYQEADRLGIWYPASDFEPLGLYLTPNRPIEIHVENTQGNSQPKLLVGTYSRYTYADVPTVYELAAGSNTIADPEGGLLYLQFVTEETPSAEAQVTIRGASPIPSYVLGESTHEEWLHDLKTLSYEDVQFISNKTMVVVSKAAALQYQDEDQDFMLTTLDRISDTADYISGVDGSSDLHKPNAHKILLTELAEEDVDFMLAAEEYRIVVPTESIRFIMDPDFASSASWGLWHEMGHHRQALNWDWNEVDEVTVNIYSLACLYEFDGTITWLKGSEVWDVLADYFKTPIEERHFNSDQTIGGNGRLAMFRQLWMAFGDEFYIKLHQLAREDNAKTEPRIAARDLDSENQMANFMVFASQASGCNLTNFFREWGFVLPQDDFDVLAALNLPDPEIDLISLRE